MTAPLRVSSDLLAQSTGYTADQWRRSALAASDALRQNPRDAEARAFLTQAQAVLRDHARTVGEATALTNAEDRRPATTTGTAFAVGLGQGASAGFADELSGLLSAGVTARFGTGSPGLAYTDARDAHRAYVDAARQDHPVSSTVGDVLGFGLSSGLATVKAATALPAFGRALAGGSAVGAGFGARALSAGAAALAAGTAGAARGFGSADGELSERVGGAVLGGAGSAALGGAATYGGNWLLRGGKQVLRALREVRTPAPAAEVPGAVPAPAPTPARFQRAAQMLHPNDPSAQQRAIERMALAEGSVTGTPVRAAPNPEAPRVSPEGVPIPTMQGRVMPPRTVEEAQAASLREIERRQVADAARGAYNASVEAVGPAGAKDAARRAAAMRTSALPDPVATNLQSELEASLALGNIFRKPPTEDALREFVQFVQGLSPEMQRRALMSAPAHWKPLLGL